MKLEVISGKKVLCAQISMYNAHQPIKPTMTHEDPIPHMMKTYLQNHPMIGSLFSPYHQRPPMTPVKFPISLSKLLYDYLTNSPNAMPS